MEKHGSSGKGRRCNTENIEREFYLHPIRNFSKVTCTFRKPVEVGHFSLDGERKYHDDKSQLRCYTEPVKKPFRFNLREGYASYVEKDDDIKERLTHLLMWILKHRDVFLLKDQKHSNDFSFNTDFISWRGHLTKFLITPYQLKEPWKFGVTRFKGTLFISEIETEKARYERANRNPHQQEMCYWGYKFEDYLTQQMDEKQDGEDLLPEKSDTKEASPSVVNSNEAFCSVVRTRLQKTGKSFSILAGAEVDCCIKSHPDKPPESYIELKTSRLMQTEKQTRSFMRFKLLKYWAQSFLSGLPKIVVGLRDDDGVVSCLKEYETLKIPSVTEEYCSVEWDDKLCLNFLCEFLSWMKKIVVLDGPNVVYIMSFDEPFDYVSVKLVDDGSERFLPSWFTDEFTSTDA